MSTKKPIQIFIQVVTFNDSIIDVLTDLCSELISKISIEVLCIDVRASAVEFDVADVTVDAGVSVDVNADGSKAVMTVLGFTLPTSSEEPLFFC